MNRIHVACMIGMAMFLDGCSSAPVVVGTIEKQEQYAYYVSPNGNDAFEGTSAQQTDNNGPFRTLERARDAIRNLKTVSGLPFGGITVYLRGGVYPIDDSYALTKEDSGSDHAPIVYQAYPGETVRIIGGKELHDFTAVQDARILSRWRQEVRDHIVQFDLKSQGVDNFGTLYPRGFGRPMYPAALELFFDNRPMRLARYPNDDWLTITDTPKGSNGGVFRYDDNRPKEWETSDAVWVHGYWTQDWADSYERVASLDANAGEIATAKPHGVYGYKKKQRFRFLNVLEEIDQPGEWYLDRESGILYFYPPGQMENRSIVVSLLEKPLVTMNDVSHVSFRDIVFEAGRSHGIEIRGGKDNRIAGCTLRNLGNTGVVVNGGTGHQVSGCDIYDVCDGGINLSGGDRNTLEPANHVANNNEITRYSRWSRTYRPAVRASGVGIRISHNRIHDAPHTGILIGGNDHIIEFNEIYDICKETGDVGAFYMGRDWTMRGNVVRYNFFHDLNGPYTYGAMAVYLDDAASGTTIYGNVFYQASRAAFIGGGRDNTVENNLFIDCHPSVHIDARGLGWAKKHIVKGGGWHMYDKLAAVKYDQPPYTLHYPKLQNILDGDPAYPMGNRVLRNISYGGEWLNLQQVDREWVEWGENLVDADPKIENLEDMNFNLRDDSPAFGIGFKRIPFDRIGLVLDDDRKIIPE